MLVEIVAGLTWLGWVLLLGGLALLAAEMLLPGFGIFGISGTAALIAFVMLNAHGLSERLVLLSVIVILAALEFLLVYLCFLRRMPSKIRLSEEVEGKSIPAVRQLPSVGEKGIALTALRPAGTVRIGGEHWEVVSEEGYIETGAAITVVSLSDGKISVCTDRADPV